MMRAIGRGAKRAHGLFALTIATVLALDPFLLWLKAIRCLREIPP